MVRASGTMEEHFSGLPQLPRQHDSSLPHLPYTRPGASGFRWRDIAVDQALDITEFAESYRKLDWKPVPLPKE